MNRDHDLQATFFSSNQLDDTWESRIHISLLTNYRCQHQLKTQPIKGLWWALRLSLAFEWNHEDSEQESRYCMKMSDDLLLVTASLNSKWILKLWDKHHGILWKWNYCVCILTKIKWNEYEINSHCLLHIHINEGWGVYSACKTV